MSAVLSDQAIELLMAMSTGALARAGAKRYPALAQHFGIRPDAPPAEQSAAEVPPMSAPAEEPPPFLQRPPDWLSSSDRTLVGRVPASVARRTKIPVPGSTKGELKPVHKDSERFMKRENIDPSELYNVTNEGLKGRTIPDTAEPQRTA